MNVKYRYTLITLFLSIIIVLGSMFGMNQILQNREKSLLSETGNAITQSPVRSWQKEEPDTNVNNTPKGDNEYTLSLKQIINSFNTWNMRAGEIIHDPVKGQISMEEAIEHGKIWIDSMKNQMMQKDGNTQVQFASGSDVYSVSAVLSIGKDTEPTEVKIEPYFSFWTVLYTSQSMDVTLYLNAVTGNVWSADINLYEGIPKEIPMESLSLFAELTGVEKSIQTEPKINADKNQVVMSWNDGIDVQMNYLVINIDKNSIVDYSPSGIFTENYAAISYELATK